MIKSAVDYDGRARSALLAGRRTWLKASQRVLRAAEGAVSDVLIELEQRTPGPRRGAEATQRMRDVVTRDRAAAAECAPSRQAPQESLEPEPSRVTDEVTAPKGPASCRPQPTVSDDGGEPIRTRTYARLLSAQGYPERALAIYVHLMGENPSDASLAAEATELRRQIELEHALPVCG